MISSTLRTDVPDLSRSVEAKYFIMVFINKPLFVLSDLKDYLCNKIITSAHDLPNLWRHDEY